MCIRNEFVNFMSNHFQNLQFLDTHSSYPYNFNRKFDFTFIHKSVGLHPLTILAAVELKNTTVSINDTEKGQIMDAVARVWNFTPRKSDVFGIATNGTEAFLICQTHTGYSIPFQR
jgi:hypothetical protein